MRFSLLMSSIISRVPSFFPSPLTSGSTVRLTEMRLPVRQDHFLIDDKLGTLGFADPLDLFEHPGVGAGEEVLGGAVDDVGGGDLQDAQAGGVAGDDPAVLIERNDRRSTCFAACFRCSS